MSVSYLSETQALGVYNLRDYGILTTNTAAQNDLGIDALLLDLPSTGAIIAGPRGSYLVSDTVYFPSNVTFRGLWGGSVDSGAGPINGTQFKWAGAAGGVVCKIFNAEYVVVDGLSIHGGQIAGVTGILVDSDNGGGGPLVTTHQIDLQHISVDQCGTLDGVAGTGGTGIQLGTSAGTAYQSDGICIKNFAIHNCESGFGINSGNAADYSRIENGVIQNVNRGFNLLYSPYFTIADVAFGGAAVTKYQGVLSDQTAIWIGGLSGTLRIEGCQAEGGYVYSLVVASGATAQSTKPITVESCHWDRDIDVRAQRRFAGHGNEFNCNVDLASNAVWIEDGGTFEAGKGFVCSGGAVALWIGQQGVIQSYGAQNGVLFGSSIRRTVQSVAYGTGTIATDAAAGDIIRVGTLTGTLIVSAPSNGSAGQELTYLLTQDATGGRAVAWSGVFKHSWSDAGNTANRKASVTFINDGVDWVQVGAQRAWA